MPITCENLGLGQPVVMLVHEHLHLALIEAAQQMAQQVAVLDQPGISGAGTLTVASEEVQGAALGAAIAMRIRQWLVVTR